MAWLMELGPPPEEKTLGDLCKEFGVLPSQVKDLDDWRFLANYAAVNNLARSWNDWNSMISILSRNPHADVSMPMDVIQYMLGLMDEAREQYGKEDQHRR